MVVPAETASETGFRFFFCPLLLLLLLLLWLLLLPLLSCCFDLLDFCFLLLLLFEFPRRFGSSCDFVDFPDCSDADVIVTAVGADAKDTTEVEPQETSSGRVESVVEYEYFRGFAAEVVVVVVVAAVAVVGSGTLRDGDSLGVSSLGSLATDWFLALLLLLLLSATKTSLGSSSSSSGIGEVVDRKCGCLIRPRRK